MSNKFVCLCLALFVGLVGCGGSAPPSVSDVATLVVEEVVPDEQPTLAVTVTPTRDWLAPRPTVNGMEIASRESNSLRFLPSRFGWGVQDGGGQDLFDAGLMSEWVDAHVEAGLPVVVRAVGDASALLLAQERVADDDFASVLIYRFPDMPEPDYGADPVMEAEAHWAFLLENLPAGLDREVVWLETMDEFDWLEPEWVAVYARRQAELALEEGYRVALFSWMTGTPEQKGWVNDEALETLRLIAEHPDQLAVGLHEYALVEGPLVFGFPFNVGRFLGLLQTVDARGIGRPTILITEFGWSEEQMPAPGEGMEHLQWAMSFYNQFESVRGVAIAGLGDDVLNESAEALFPAMLNYNLSSFVPVPIEGIDANPDLFMP